MIFYNDNAIFAFAFALAVGGGVYSYFRAPMPSLWCGLAGLLVFDVVCRINNRDEHDVLINPSAGAHFMFIPVWIHACVFAVIGVVLMFI